MFALLIVTGSKVFYDFVNDILSSLHFDSFNWKPSARDFVTNLSTRDCIELVSFFSTHSARVVSSAYFQMFVFATLRSLIITRNNQGPSLVDKALCRLCNKFFKDDVIQGGSVECTLHNMVKTSLNDLFQKRGFVFTTVRGIEYSIQIHSF